MEAFLFSLVRDNPSPTVPFLNLACNSHSLFALSGAYLFIYLVYLFLYTSVSGVSRRCFHSFHTMHVDEESLIMTM